jgi:hypothetical protein
MIHLVHVITHRISHHISPSITISHHICATSNSVGEVEECYKNIAGDREMILQLRKKAAESERRASKAISAAERWRLPQVLLKSMRNQFLSVREEETLKPVLDREAAKFKTQNQNMRKSLEEPLSPLLSPKASLGSPRWTLAAGMSTFKRSLSRMTSGSKLKADMGEGEIERSNRVKPQRALQSPNTLYTLYRVRSPTHVDIADMGTEQKEEKQGPFADMSDKRCLSMPFIDTEHESMDKFPTKSPKRSNFEMFGLSPKSSPIHPRFTNRQLSATVNASAEKGAHRHNGEKKRKTVLSRPRTADSHRRREEKGVGHAVTRIFAMMKV